METAFNRPTGHAYIDWVGQVKNLLANDTIPPCKMVGMHTFREFAEEGRRRMRDASTVDSSVKASIEKYGVGLTNFYKSFGMKNLEKPAGVEYKMKLPHHLSGSEGESEGEESLGESVSEPESGEPGTSTAASFVWRTRRVDAPKGGYDSALESRLSEALGTKKAARTIAKAKERRAAATAREARETRAAAKKAGERGRRRSSKTDMGTESSASTPISFPTPSKASKAVAQALTGGGGGGNSSGGGSKKNSSGSGSSSSGKKRGRPMKIEGRIVTIENPFTGSRQSIQNKQ